MFSKRALGLLYLVLRQLLTQASTGTRVPARTRVRVGVMMMAPRVEAVVMSTDKATSP